METPHGDSNLHLDQDEDLDDDEEAKEDGQSSETFKDDGAEELCKEKTMNLSMSFHLVFCNSIGTKIIRKLLFHHCILVLLFFLLFLLLLD